jgi:hypothetical protein
MIIFIMENYLIQQFFPIIFQKIYLVHFHTDAYIGICVFTFSRRYTAAGPDDEGGG